MRSKIVREVRVPTVKDFHRKIELFLEKGLHGRPKVPNNYMWTGVQLEWISRELNRTQDSFIVWGRVGTSLRIHIAICRTKALGVEAFKYVRKFGFKRFIVAALSYLMQNLRRRLKQTGGIQRIE